LRRFLTLVLVICLCFSLMACSESTIVREKTNLQGTSDGTFYFTEGNIKFTVSADQLYTIAQNEVDLKDERNNFITACILGLGDSTTNIWATPVDHLSESEVISLISSYNEYEAEEYANHTRFDDLIMDIMGHEVAFRTYLNESEENAKFHMETTFTDSYYIYSVEIQLPEITEKRYAAVFEMICFSEYIGPEKRFNYFQ